MDDLTSRALVRNTAFDAFGNKFQVILNVLLEVTVCRPACHGTDRAHPAIGFVRTALIQNDLTRGFVGTGQKRANHAGAGTRSHCLGNVARKLDTAIGDDRNVKLVTNFRAFKDCRQLRDTDTGNNTSGTDRTRTDADLDRIRTGFGQCLYGFGGGNVTGDDLGIADL